MGRAFIAIAAVGSNYYFSFSVSRSISSAEIAGA
jgi:hypothetical protein